MHISKKNWLWDQLPDHRLDLPQSSANPTIAKNHNKDASSKPISILEKLKEYTFNVDIRTIERDSTQHDDSSIYFEVIFKVGRSENNSK